MEMLVVMLLLGCLIGFLLGLPILQSRSKVRLAEAAKQLQLVEAERTYLHASCEELKEAKSKLEVSLATERAEHLTVREKVAALDARFNAEKTASEARITSILDVEKNLKDSFEALARRALDANSNALLSLATEQWKKHRSEADSDLSNRQLSIDHALKPIGESLSKLTEQTQHLEVSREGAYQAILGEIKNIQDGNLFLAKQTSQLVQALRSPRVRGNWGELQLQKCIEYSGMVQHASFKLQSVVKDDEGTYRPDLEILLPNGRVLIVDAKTPLEAWLSAMEASDEEKRTEFLRIHADNVRSHVKSLSQKAYWKQFSQSPDFVICFLPSEVLFAAALEQDPTLIEFGATSNVLLATPTTLIGMLRAVACGWQQAAIADNAKKIQEEALRAYEKLRGMQADFKDLGSKLHKASESYNAVLTKVEGRGGLFAIARKIKSYHIGDREIPETLYEPVPLRQLSADDWEENDDLAVGDSVEIL
jgi:DNA recombination protein RmuC